MAKQSLINLHIYHQFVKRYQSDLEAFCYEVCGLPLTHDQRDLAQVTVNPRARISVVSGTGTGKTAAMACIALWHLCCFPVAFYEGKTEIGSNTYIGAAALQQVTDGVWKEMTDRFAHMKTIVELKWLTTRIKPMSERWYIEGYKETWFITRLALGNSDSAAIAGKHRFWQLIIVDEASGVNDSHFNVIAGTQTQAGNRTLLFSQGTKTVGYFYETHHRLGQFNTNIEAGGWVNLCFNSENAPHVTQQWLQERQIECGGRDSVEYRIRVLGQFAEDEEKNLINRRIIDTNLSMKKPVIREEENWGWFLLCDVAMGEYRDYSVCVLAKVIGNGSIIDADPRRVVFHSIPIYSNGIDMHQFRGRILEEYQKLSNARVLVDAGGNGLQLCKDLEDEGLDVHRVSWGKSCFKNANKDRFINLRAQAMVALRDAIREGYCNLPTNLEPKIREAMIFQATHLPYSFTEQSRYQMQSKEKMREKGIKSPDIIDAFSFAFLERVHYNVSERSGSGVKEERRQNLRNRLLDKMGAASNAN